MDDRAASLESEVFLLLKMTYKEQLANPKWQKKRLEIFQRDKFTCQICLDTDTQLQVHHKYYDKTYQTMAWDYPNHSYQTLCSDCHKALTEHLEEHGTDNEFSVLRIKNVGRPDSLFFYKNGILRFDVSSCEGYLNFTENTTHKIVQFLINNWLKNG